MLGRKSKISAVELLKNSLVSQDFSEAISEFSSSEFVSPFLEFAKLESEEDAKLKAQELLDFIIRISELNTEEASKVVDLLFKSRTELGGNVLHALIWEARFSPINQLAVIEVLSNSTKFIYGLISEKDNQNATPIDFFVTFLDKDFSGFEQIGLLALELGANIPDFLHGAMREKHHNLVATIYKHPNYEISGDEQIMYLVHREKFKEFYPAFATDEALLKFKYNYDEKKTFEFIADALIKKGNRLNEKDANGQTPIHLAVQFSYTETVKTLIANGAYLDSKNIYGETPLQMAIDLGNTKIATELIEKGANVKEKDGFGKIALHFAAIKDLTETVIS